MPVAAVIVVAGLEIAQTVQKKKAADAAATTATQVADYNNRLDQSQATQVDLDAQSNIDAMRKDASVYMSRQASAYAGAGIVANTGSALAVQAATAGKFALREQQTYSDAEAKEDYLYSEGQAGVAAGAAKADQYKMAGDAAVLQGASQVVGSVYGAYNQGAFSGTGSNDLSESLD